ncbi:tetratricopeptide repeat protein [Arthrobacter sunyaminii]|uniref:Tetratricopeptide repeat protein n=1 Tax=Arthrobacter sunyaminii TaxID=2816859 RepID=A0A975PEI4_9MICC|nr:tetratricopeptide repeat protein [Arthrobacter sunyaminii]MBO0907511.1 tetratricopeptide repeat protein [Arthrobacter sunyaminii]QWQ35087.1 tetratricopeptide repeat protein [Arthrobacter sunyaminii]
MNQAHYSIHPATLREICNDDEAAERKIAQLESVGESGDAERISWLRIAGRLVEAEALGWSTLITREGATGAHQVMQPLPFGAVAASLRLAHVLHWMERYSEAEVLFLAALTSAETEANKNKASNAALTMVAFAQQHIGKMYFDQGRFIDALACFHKALAIRQELKSPMDQIESTLQALETTKALMS